MISDRLLSEERPYVMLNQFPCESLLTVKDCLAAVARRLRGGPSPDWLPETFNLQTELPQFIKNYQQRQQRWAAPSETHCCWGGVTAVVCRLCVVIHLAVV